MKVGAYCRVSTDKQFEEGFSIPVQQAKLKAYCDSKDWTLYKVYTDPGFSGANTDRPALNRLIRDVKNGLVDMVLVYKLDRLSRSQKDTLYLIEDVFIANNCNFASITENFDTSTPLGRAMIGILSVFAQLEREQIKERMMMGRYARAEKGEWRGGSGIPTGYDYVKKMGDVPGHIIINEYEAMQVREIYDLFVYKKMTYHAIYEYLREKKYHTKRGAWTGGATVIKNILINKIYIGKMRYGGNWYDGVHEPIIDKELFDKAQDRVVEYQATLNKHLREPYKANHLLTGTLFCGNCGTRMCYHKSSYKKANGEKVHYEKYTCYTSNAHKKMRADRSKLTGKCHQWNVSDLENTVIDEIRKLKFDNKLIKESSSTKDDEHEQRKDAIKSRINEIDKQVEKLIDLYSLGTMPLNIVQKRSEDLNSERDTLADELTALELKRVKMPISDAKKIINTVDKVMQGDDLEQKRAFIQSLIEKIVTHKDSIEIYWRF